MCLEVSTDVVFVCGCCFLVGLLVVCLVSADSVSCVCLKVFCLCCVCPSMFGCFSWASMFVYCFGVSRKIMVLRFWYAID